MLRRALLALALLAAPAAAQEGLVTSERATFRVTTFATGLERPWGAVFLPDGTMLVTERPGRLRRIGTDGRVSAPLGGAPQVDANGQGGLLDIALPPDVARSSFASTLSPLKRIAAVTRWVTPRRVAAASASCGFSTTPTGG